MDASTIAAIATPAGSGGIGIVKISGSRAIAIARAIFRAPGAPSNGFTSHRLYYGHIVDPKTGQVIDEVMLGVMRAPRTYTREDIVEINAHSGSIVLRRILELVLQQGAQMAGPGEFTQRAFVNGRIDLTQAEGVIDAINAKSEHALGAAVLQIEGQLKQQITTIRNVLLDVLTEIEAAIDFPEEADDGRPGSVMAEQIRNEAIAPMARLLQRYDSGHILREGVRMILVGRPNVGKSSLMNRLLRKERVIVTAVPGTTRDLIEETVHIRGVPVVIADSAGLHGSEDPVEQMGIEKTQAHLDLCDLVLLLIDGPVGVTAQDQEIYRKVRHKRPMVVVNKIDLMDRAEKIALPESWSSADVVHLSAKYGTGMAQLESTIARHVLGSDAVTAEFGLIPNLRHKRAIVAAMAAAKDAEAHCIAGGMEEMTAVDIRTAVDALGEIIGETMRADLLDEIFSRFCIGK